MAQESKIDLDGVRNLLGSNLPHNNPRSITFTSIIKLLILSSF